MDEFYVNKIEAALGIAEPGKTRIKFEFLDCLHAIGMAWEMPNGCRYSARCPFRPGWDERLIDLAQEMLSGVVPTHG